MAKVRDTETPIEGKVPNTDNLRLDLRSSAGGEDPRIKASLYDFDANGMLQSITYVWDRPPGLVLAPDLCRASDRAVAVLHPSPAATAIDRRPQGDTALGRLILQDMPERNLLLQVQGASSSGTSQRGAGRVGSIGRMRIGIDLGGTKIEIMALDDGAALLRRRVATPQTGYRATVEAVVNLVGKRKRNWARRHGRHRHAGGAVPRQRPA